MKSFLRVSLGCQQKNHRAQNFSLKSTRNHFQLPIVQILISNHKGSKFVSYKFKHALFCRKVTWWQELFYRISKSSLSKTHLTRHQNTFALQGHHMALYDSNSLQVMKIINLFYKLVVVLSRILCMITSTKIYKDSHSDFRTPSTKTSQLSWPSSVDGKSERRLTEASSATC